VPKNSCDIRFDPVCAHNKEGIEAMWKKAATLAKAVSAKPTIKLKSAVASAPGDQAQAVKSVSEEAIRPRAHQKWEAAGKPDGDGLRFWLEAEREIAQAK
jgi:Protein of unknown function (DUF2934)